ncbi:MAG: hypothetical protein J6X84_09400 [Treponema sp.]|nr:hypothetical protein [Treponema sp.]
MKSGTKLANDYKFGMTGAKKKIGINNWRFVFNAINTVTGSEQMFYIEFEMLNSWVSQDEVLLGYKPRVKISADDLQYALAGTDSAKSINTEDIVQPSYCAVRIGTFGSDGKQLCSYYPVKNVSFNLKPFEIIVDNKYFNENKIGGFLNISEADNSAHPEYLCDFGYAKWELTYKIKKNYKIGYKSDSFRWFPLGLQTEFSGNIHFNGKEYAVDPRRCRGYTERFWGKSIPEPYFHVSAANCTSVISGKTLLDSSFAITGIFDNRVSFVGNFEDIDIDFCADAGKRQFSVVWDCSQMPEAENPEENLLHWSVSINSKLWVIDVDVFCKIKELNNRTLELPEGNRKILSLLEGGTGTGEIKLYKRNGNTLEQIEHATLAKVLCEFGHIEEGEF